MSIHDFKLFLAWWLKVALFLHFKILLECLLIDLFLPQFKKSSLRILLLLPNILSKQKSCRNFLLYRGSRYAVIEYLKFLSKLSNLRVNSEFIACITDSILFSTSKSEVWRSFLRHNKMNFLCYRGRMKA